MILFWLLHILSHSREGAIWKKSNVVDLAYQSLEHLDGIYDERIERSNAMANFIDITILILSEL